jgi:hypothetical protein
MKAGKQYFQEYHQIQQSWRLLTSNNLLTENMVKSRTKKHAKDWLSDDDHLFLEPDFPAISLYYIDG